MRNVHITSLLSGFIVCVVGAAGIGLLCLVAYWFYRLPVQATNILGSLILFYCIGYKFNIFDKLINELKGDAKDDSR